MVTNLDLISWNVRGLNSDACCSVVHELIIETKCNLACLQEMKLRIVNDTLSQYLGGYKLDWFAYKPARGTKGGILLL
ncbi:hypothetical protein E2562_037438 [Oryza meyeriana var. granulata]|uniref:Endonuclease/exonuclease/phosphatase domain-containing protein n=1 Tax=Oryza meyeriana var. granulata TaxID=110450 RepID=A0A6G1FG51_9ORYZ|nr:hypothetical protein E2562_037438 [Oryza meyeriana var. granulata]